MNQKFDALAQQQKEMLDDLVVRNKKLAFGSTFRGLVQCSLIEMIDVMGYRYEYLRKNEPERFSVSDQDWWNNAYS